MGRSLAKGVINLTGGVGRDPEGSWRINLVTVTYLAATNHWYVDLSRIRVDIELDWVAMAVVNYYGEEFL